jgi:hypothetical protein
MFAQAANWQRKRGGEEVRECKLRGTEREVKEEKRKSWKKKR